jgi:predicted Zn-dependent protease
MPLSRILRERGLASALQTYQQLQETGIDNYDLDPAHFYDTAQILFEIKQLPEAIEILKLGAVIQPESDTLYYYLASAYTRSGDKAQAIENVQRCLALNPKHQEANKLLKELHLEKGVNQ